MVKVALVIDWLTEVGGAERVLLMAHKAFPDAPIYTSQYRPRRIDWFRDATVHTGWLNLFPVKLRKFMAPLRALYFSHLKLNGYDVVLSIVNSEAKGIKTDGYHIAYLQGPPVQYYWGMYDEYIKHPGFGKLDWLARLGLKILVRPMRWSDLTLSRRPDLIVANSTYVAQEVKQYYGRTAEVLPPPVAVWRLSKLKAKPYPKFDGQPFFMVAGRQVNWKRFDLAIKACLKAKVNLLVVGDGPEHKKLVQLAGDSPRIKFLPRYDTPERLANYFRAAEGFIFCSKEPFGITPVEAMACGLPVLAFNQGGSLDIVRRGVNGDFFNAQSVEALARALKKWHRSDYDTRRVKRSVQQFDETEFIEQLKQVVNDARR